MANGKTKTTFHFSQYIDGMLQADPLAGGRDEFAPFTLRYGQQSDEARAWVREHSTGMVCISWRAEQQAGKGLLKVTYSPVTFEFQSPAEATYVKLTFGGAA